MTTDAPRHTTISILDADTAADKARWVRTRRDDWTPLHPLAPAFILGTAAYHENKGRPDDLATYTRKVRHSNPILKQGMGDVMKIIVAALEETFDAPFLVDERLGLPGMHIFEPSPHFTTRFASTHFDRQWELLDLSDYDGIDSSRILSFTLPLELPTGGGGLLLWPKVADPTHAGGATQETPTPDDMTREDIEYEVGDLVVHDGWHLHEMAPFRDPDGDRARITMQGHAIKATDGWIVHW